MTKDAFYRDHQKLIFKMAWIFHFKTGIEVEELISEFNIVFCEAFDEYDPDSKIKFSSFLCNCCSNRIKNILKKLSRKKRKMEILTDLEIYITSHDPMDSIILFDNFVNNENPIVKEVAKIVSTCQLPKTDFRRWLKGILQSQGYPMPAVLEAFKILQTIYDPNV